MMLNPVFVKSLKQYLFIAFSILIVRLIMDALGLSGYSADNPNSPMRILANFLVNIFIVITFWYFVYKVTGEKLGAILAFILQCLPMVYSSLSFLQEGFSIETHQLIARNGKWFNVAAFISFGLMHFKSWKGVFMVFASLLSQGLNLGNGIYAFKRWVLSSYKIRQLFEFRINMEDGSRTIDFFVPLMYTFYPILGFIIFWYVYNEIKFDRKIDFSMRTSSFFTKIDKTTFSIIFWSLRIPIAFLSYGLLAFVSTLHSNNNSVSGINYGFYMDTAFNISFCILAIYVVGSIFRNFLCNYFALKNEYPSWLFILLNVPVVNVFTWLYLMFTAKQFRRGIDEEIEGVASSTSLTDGLKIKFNKDEKNSQLKIVVMVFLVISMVGKFLIRDVGISSFSLLGVLLYVFIGIVFALLYMNYRNAFYVFFIIQVLIILLITGLSTHLKLDEEEFSQFYSFSGIINLVLYYALFHFDQLKFISPLEEDSVRKAAL